MGRRGNLLTWRGGKGGRAVMDIASICAGAAAPGKEGSMQFVRIRHTTIRGLLQRNSMSNVALGLLILGSGIVAGAAMASLWVWRRKVLPPDRAATMFQQQREHLEADFLHAAASFGKPRGLRWKKCDWESDIILARDKKSGELTALVGVTIQFEAIEGSDMEGLPAVGNLRHASGVFYLRGGRWRTT